jgi:hypothetical protein
MEIDMKVVIRTMLVAALLAVPGASGALAGAQDFTFEPVAKEVRSGPGSELAVRLIHKSDGKPVEGAVIFRTRLDMSPDNMEAMTSEVAPESSTEPGVYKFRGDLSMDGSWALKLQAKVQGEPETVQGTVVFTAKK